MEQFIRSRHGWGLINHEYSHRWHRIYVSRSYQISMSFISSTAWRCYASFSVTSIHDTGSYIFDLASFDDVQILTDSNHPNADYLQSVVLAQSNTKRCWVFGDQDGDVAGVVQRRPDRCSKECWGARLAATGQLAPVALKLYSMR